MNTSLSISRAAEHDKVKDGTVALRAWISDETYDGRHSSSDEAWPELIELSAAAERAAQKMIDLVAAGQTDIPDDLAAFVRPGDTPDALEVVECQEVVDDDGRDVMRTVTLVAARQ